MASSAATAQIVSLDDYRRARTRSAQPQSQPTQTAPTIPMAPAVWGFWVPGWVW
jgi:hypothetical protein